MTKNITAATAALLISFTQASAGEGDQCILTIQNLGTNTTVIHGVVSEQDCIDVAYASPAFENTVATVVFIPDKDKNPTAKNYSHRCIVPQASRGRPNPSEAMPTCQKLNLPSNEIK